MDMILHVLKEKLRQASLRNYRIEHCMTIDSYQMDLNIVKSYIKDGKYFHAPVAPCNTSSFLNGISCFNGRY